MPKMEQALYLDPAYELLFKGPYTDVTTSVLHLTNPTEAPICFKVKTTAPKIYCVRPNCGVVRPMDTVSVAVMLQPIVPDTFSMEKSSHKFMVQSMFTSTSYVNLETVWHNVSPDEMMHSKLRCVFDPPLESHMSPVDIINAGDKAKDKARDKAKNKGKDKAKEIKETEPLSETFTIASPTYVRPSAPLASYKTPGVMAASSQGRADSIGDEKASDVPLQVMRLVDNNRRLKEELAEVSRENTQLKAVEEGLRSRFTTPTFEAQQLHILRELDGEEIEKEDEQGANLIHKWLCFLFVAVVIFLLGIISGNYLQ